MLQMLPGVVPCFEPSPLVPKAQEAIAVFCSAMGPRLLPTM